MQHTIEIAFEIRLTSIHDGKVVVEVVVKSSNKSGASFTPSSKQQRVLWKHIELYECQLRIESIDHLI